MKRNTIRFNLLEQSFWKAVFLCLHPSKSLRPLKWFDIFIVTVLMFGEFIIRSTQQFMESLSPLTLTSVAETTTNVASDGAAYSSNFTFQLMMLGITLLYLLIAWGT